LYGVASLQRKCAELEASLTEKTAAVAAGSAAHAEAVEALEATRVRAEAAAAKAEAAEAREAAATAAAAKAEATLNDANAQVKQPGMTAVAPDPSRSRDCVRAGCVWTVCSWVVRALCGARLLSFEVTRRHISLPQMIDAGAEKASKGGGVASGELTRDGVYERRQRNIHRRGG
jgi:hypothetical protein